MEFLILDFIFPIEKQLIRLSYDSKSALSQSKIDNKRSPFRI